jgi:hypothetical protein
MPLASSHAGIVHQAGIPARSIRQFNGHLRYFQKKLAAAGATLEEMDSTLHRRDSLICNTLVDFGTPRACWFNARGASVPRVLQYDGQPRRRPHGDGKPNDKCPRHLGRPNDESSRHLVG